jgi:hypothetical protein
VSGGGESFGELGVTLDFTGSQVVIGVRGELDLLTAPDLGAVLDAVVDRGHPHVVVDLGELGVLSSPLQHRAGHEIPRHGGG